MYKTIEEEVLQQYRKGNFCPLGADGGVLKYITCSVKQGKARASITLDSDIAKIRSIWELSIDTDGKGLKELYDFTDQYYKLR